MNHSVCNPLSVYGNALLRIVQTVSSLYGGMQLKGLEQWLLDDDRAQNETWNKLALDDNTFFYLRYDTLLNIVSLVLSSTPCSIDPVCSLALLFLSLSLLYCARRHGGLASLGNENRKQRRSATDGSTEHTGYRRFPLVSLSRNKWKPSDIMCSTQQIKA